MNRSARLLFFLILMCLAAPSFGQLWSGIIAPPRAVDWSQAGVVGGIPSGSWAQCGTTIAAGASVATINSAISSCPANHFVQLGSGTFNLTTGLLFSAKNNVAVRGMGADQTFLVFSGNQSCLGIFAVVCFSSTDANYWGGPSNLANWSAGYSRGSSTITLSSTTNLSIGKAIMLDQTDDPSGTDNGAVFVCYTPKGVCSTNGDSGGGPRPNRSQQQMVTVTSISGSSVGISPPIVMANWASGKSPQAWWATNPISGSGVEDLSISISSSGAKVGVGFLNCNGCWVRGIRSVGPPGRSHVQIFQSNHITVQDNYFYQTNDSASVNYGVEEIPSSDSLIQNNIFEQVQAPYPANGSCTGCVFAYNFDVNDVFAGGTFQNQSGFPHAVGDENILYEGNIGSGIYSDNFHGSHHLMTIFRNYWNGYQKNEGNFTNNATVPIILGAYSRFYNIIGNVLGNCARQSVYESAVGNVHSGPVIYQIGFGNSIPDDANTVTTLMRWGNFDCVTNSNRFLSAEVPSGLSGTQAPYANPVPSTQTLPASFYLTAKPSWWPSSKAWPPMGPDVTGGNVQYCSGGSQTGTYVTASAQCPGGTVTTLAGGRINSNPAMDCYLEIMSGPPDGMGGVRNFSASSCYTSAAQINPPTGLAATVK